MTDAGGPLRPRPSLVFVDHCQTDRLQDRERPTHVTSGDKSFSTGHATVCFYCHKRSTRLRGLPGERRFCRPSERVAGEKRQTTATPADGKIRTN